LHARRSTAWEDVGGDTELAPRRPQAIVIDALAGVLHALRDGVMAMRDEHTEEGAIEAPSAEERTQTAECGGRPRDEADRADRARVRAVRSAISGPQRLPYTIQPPRDHERTAVAQLTRRPSRGD
jgi:hypothetical protein